MVLVTSDDARSRARPLGGSFDRTCATRSRLARAVALMNGAEDDQSPESNAEDAIIAAHNKGAKRLDRRTIPRGFAVGSDAWKAARDLGFPLKKNLERSPERGAFDLFSTPVTRYEIDTERMWADNMVPWAADSSPRPDGFTDDGIAHGDGWGWSANEVAVICPRALCLIPRTSWEAGYRQCAMC